MSHRFIIRKCLTFVVSQYRNKLAIVQRAYISSLLHQGPHSGSLSSSLTKGVAPQQPVDLLMQNLRSATDTSDILYSVKQHHAIMNDAHISQAFNSIFTLQKSHNSSITNREVVKHQSFNLLCKTLHQRIRYFELNDQLNALKVLSFMGTPSISKTIQILLQLIVKQVNNLTLHQITFLDFMLKDFNSCPLVDALKIALPVVFESQFRIQRNECDVKQLSDFFLYAVKRRLSESCIDLFVEVLIANKDAFTVDSSKLIVRSLCEAKGSSDMHRTLLHTCLDNIIDNIEKISFIDLNTVLARLTTSYSKRNMPYFYHEEFVNACADFVIKKQYSDEQASWVLKSSNRFQHMHKGLLDYICNIVAENSSNLDQWHDGMFLTLINGMAVSDYRPEKFSEFEREIVNHITSLTDRLDLPWLRIALDLCTLDCWSHALFNTLFEEQFLDKFLKRDNFEDSFELVYLYQAITTLCPSYTGNMPPKAMIKNAIKKVRQYDPTEPSPLLPALRHGLGGPTYVQSQIYTKMGHFIDHVVVMRKGGYFVSLKNTENLSNTPITLEDIAVPEDSQIVLVLYLTPYQCTTNTGRILGHVRQNINTLEAMGYSVMPVTESVWNNLLDNEKIAYLMQGLQNKMQNQESIEAST